MGSGVWTKRRGCLVGIAALLAGCQTAGTSVGLETLESRPAKPGKPPAPSVSERIEADPVGFLRDRLAAAEQLDHYTLRFYRQERLGLLGQLRDVEQLDVWFRRSPRAVKMLWNDPDSQYVGVLYDASRAPQTLLVLSRRGFFGPPSKPDAVPVDLPTSVGQAKRPITQFGLATTLGNTLEAIERTGADEGGRVVYKGVKHVDLIDRPAHHIAIIYNSAAGQVQHARQDVLIDTETLWPAGIYLWLPSGDLDAMYLFTDIDAQTPLPDDAFELRRPTATAPAS